jgi:hypothetical protein
VLAPGLAAIALSMIVSSGQCTPTNKTGKPARRLAQLARMCSGCYRIVVSDIGNDVEAEAAMRGDRLIERT